MLKTLRQRVTSEWFDARLAEWTAAGAALLVLYCGHCALEELGLPSVESLAGYGLILVVSLLFVNLAVLFSIYAAVAARAAGEHKP